MPRRQNERVQRLHLHDEYDSSLEYCSHATHKEEENNHEYIDDFSSNALEVLTKILFIPQGQKLLATKEYLPFLA